ncbi:hypothetical protein PRZ61_12275 [Halomonas pacifica]|uniref:phage tail terminator protein n=1 Tax=Bisbaumannia pacifica TaxID=77098 RepID=UPI002359CEC1|nr:hypothetical protein [Halomonas pacifica]MDC8804218.1 hypothetical protein [Halomonas pacifica]
MAALHDDDYLAAEGLIMAHLEAELADIQGLKIMTAADVGGVDFMRQHTPAVHVVYTGDQVPGGNATDEGDYHVLKQRWMAVVAVRSVRDQVSGKASREAAGPILSRVLKALSGWRPGPGYGTLVRINAPVPQYHKGGYVRFPLQFETVLVTQAASVD